MGKISEIFNFDNIGRKIKNLAKWSCWFAILLVWIAVPILIIGTLASGVEKPGLIIVALLASAIVVPIIIWISCWAIYAFGEFVEDLHAMRNKEGTTSEATIRREAEERAKIKEVEKAKRKKEEERFHKHIAKETAKQQETAARKQAAENAARTTALEISSAGTGYICPVCKTANISFSPCVNCQYDPQIISGDKEGEADESYIDLACPSCKETLTFLASDENAVCPYCGKQIILR